MADINELTDKLDIFRRQKIFLDKLRPDFPLSLACLSITIARQIDEVKILSFCHALDICPELIKIYRLGFTGLSRYARLIMHAGK